jgi:hypothetical protein
VYNSKNMAGFCPPQILGQLDQFLTMIEALVNAALFSQQPVRCTAVLFEMLPGIDYPELDTAVSRVWVDLTSSYAPPGWPTGGSSTLRRR